MEIICHACALMKFRAGLQSDEDKEMLIIGVNAMLKMATQLLAKPSGDAIRTKLLRDADKDGDEPQDPAI